MKTYESRGTICVKGPFGLVYRVCEIEYRWKEDDSFCYRFTPHYSVMELLSPYYFQGIPGLNLDLKKEQYVRENRTPTFISERVPSPKREDYSELLEKVGMAYMDPIKYLIRTKEQYSGDLLFVVPSELKKTVKFDFEAANETNAALIKNVLEVLCAGDDAFINGQIINDKNRKTFHDVLIAFYSHSCVSQKEKQAEGIKKAKSNGQSYRGRKPIPVDAMAFLEAIKNVEKGRLKPKEAAKKLGISIDKYYREKKRMSLLD